MAPTQPNAEKRRKTRPDQNPATKFKPKKLQGLKATPRTTAKKLNQRKEDLTLADWIEVFDYVDANPGGTQQAVVNHFRNRSTGALLFQQSALSKKLKNKETLREAARADPNALSRKRARVVTRPDVEKALALWQDKMEKKGESVTGPMLIEKRKRFEVLFEVPDEERLTGTGWLAPFKAAYGIREHRQHGEAGSVDLRLVAAERKRMKRWLSRFAPENCFNVDETSFFPSAPPDQSLCKEAMPGKKASKPTTTAVFRRNATGTEKLPVMFIGKFKSPRCFNGKNPAYMRPPIYYRNNKTAWMTGGLFEEWLRKFDGKMKNHGNTTLTMDNFSGHYVEYTPKNVKVEFFEPNLTSHVQPCDAGIIRCVKAHYRRLLSLRALELEEAGETDIFSIDILSAMRLLMKAWDEVTPETIRNCWRHTGIMPSDDETWEDLFIDPDAPDIESDVEMDGPEVKVDDPVQAGWEILKEFAQSADWTLPMAEEKLQRRLGSAYKAADWAAGLFAVTGAESPEAASKAVCLLMPRTSHTATTPHPAPSTLTEVEQELMECVNELYRRGQLQNLPTLEEVVDPAVEREDLDSEQTDNFADGELGLRQIRDYVVNRAREDVKDDESDSEDEPVFEMDRKTALAAAEYLETVCKHRGDFNTSFDLGETLRRFRGEIRCDVESSKKQVSIDTMFTRK